MNIEPLYLKCSELPAKDITALEICQANARVIGAQNVEGAQKVKNVWKLYAKSKKCRADLFIKEQLLTSQGRIRLYSKDPSKAGFFGRATEKIMIKDIPLDMENEVIRQSLESLNVVFVSAIKYSLIRGSDGSLTQFKDGDRFAYIEPRDPIPRVVKIDGHDATIYHHGKYNLTCRSCGVIGHKSGDEVCQAKPKNENMCVFRSYKNPLSNHFATPIKVFDEKDDFKSAEHAILWRMSVDLDMHELAQEIREAPHAGAAKALSKQIDDEVRYEWERVNEMTFRVILYEKFRQCAAFRECIVNNKDKIFAEATSDKRWGTGLGPAITARTDPTYWPGNNLLGAILTDMALNADDLLQEIEIEIDYSSFTSMQEKANEKVQTKIREEEAVINVSHEALRDDMSSEEDTGNDTDIAKNMDGEMIGQKTSTPNKLNNGDDNNGIGSELEMPKPPGSPEGTEAFLSYLDKVAIMLKQRHRNTPNTIETGRIEHTNDTGRM